jgi:hypothetical protein
LALDLNPDRFTSPVDEAVNINKIRVGYLSVQHCVETFFNFDLLKSLTPEYKSDYFYHYELADPLHLFIDGKYGEGIINLSDNMNKSH